MFLGGMLRVIACMKMVCVRRVRVMRSLFMGSSFVVLRRLSVVVCRLCVMVCSLCVMFRCFLRHVSLLEGFHGLVLSSASPLRIISFQNRSWVTAGSIEDE
jgi:hypothetical protein